jgi:signal transduction histidine kinase
MTAHDRIAAIIDDLLMLASESSGSSDPDPCSFGAVVEDARDTVDGIADVDVPRDGTIHADESRLRSILENLFRNAREHAGDDPTVTVGLVEDGFFVADDGPGIPEDKRDQVFEYGHTDSEDGTGLGLSIVETMADSHGWSVTATESESGGARFEFAEVFADPEETASDAGDEPAR